MNKELVTAAEARRRFCAGRLPLFEQIARGFLKTVASHQRSGDLGACQNYLDGAVDIEGAWYPRRAVVLAIEDLKQKIEAPLTLQSEARDQMARLKLDPVPELKLYRDIATAILRMDAAFHLTRVTKALYAQREAFFH